MNKLSLAVFLIFICSTITFGKDSSTCTINHFKEIKLNTELEHGFLFKALYEWIEPSIQWAKRNYD